MVSDRLLIRKSRRQIISWLFLTRDGTCLLHSSFFKCALVVSQRELNRSIPVGYVYWGAEGRSAIKAKRAFDFQTFDFSIESLYSCAFFFKYQNLIGNQIILWVLYFRSTSKISYPHEFFPPLLNLYLQPRQEIFSVCNLKHCKPEVRNSSNNYFLRTNISPRKFSKLFFVSVSKLGLRLLKHPFMNFQQSLLSFEKLLCQEKVIYLNLGFFERCLIFQLHAITFFY